MMDLPRSAWVAGTPPPLLIRDLLHRVRSWAPDQTLSYRDQRTFTYREFIDRVERLGRMLTRIGVRPGDRVGVLDWDSHRYLELFFAVPMLGAVLHTVNIRLSPEQVWYTVDHAADSVVLVHPDFLPLAESLASRLPRVRTWVTLSDAGEPPATSLPVAGDYEALLSDSAPGFAFPDLDENTVATLFYTTGTTGEPKGVYFTHRQLVLHSLGLAATFGAHAAPFRCGVEDVYLPLTPMFHVHAWGFPYVATMLGLKQIYPGRFEPGRILEWMARHEVTFSHCVPTILQMLLQHPESHRVDWTRVKLAIGGAPLARGLAEEALGRGIHLVGSYGMSETCPVVAIAHVKPDGCDADGTVDDPVGVITRTGFPVPLVQAGIMDPDGNLLPAGREHVGELVFRGHWLTEGYLNQPERTADLWRGGWLHTGDVGYRDPDGYLRITDRLKDVIKIGGEWISSLELESVLSQHPWIREVAVVGVPDARWGERPHADVVLRDGAPGDLTPRGLARHLKPFIDSGALHQRAVLTRIRIVDSLPRTSVGKVDKKALRAALPA